MINMEAKLTRGETEINHIEYSMVIILCCVIFIIVSPFVYQIYYNMSVSAAKTSTTGTIDYVKALYTNGNLEKEIGLPFTIEFTKDSFIAYDNDKKITLQTTRKIELDGKKPENGTVTIDEDGKVIVKELDFGWQTCNKEKDGDITCE